MNLHRILKALAPPAVLAVLLSSVFFLPRHENLLESSISPDLPLENNLPGWYGTKVQESDKERAILAADTRFSKARYIQKPRVPWEKPHPAVEVSIVYSGLDLNQSIHRPERCLPAQGHLNLRGCTSEITLTDGRSLKVTRLTSQLPIPGERRQSLHFVHYYFFVGHGVMHYSHMGRVIQDLFDRSARGYVQSWAYFQAGTCWSPELGITEDEADHRLRKLMSELLPGQINWQEM